MSYCLTVTSPLDGARHENKASLTPEPYSEFQVVYWKVHFLSPILVVPLFSSSISSSVMDATFLALQRLTETMRMRKAM
jgi:hypothetical protein